jgi:mannan endo-1,4-beta-mannosidase
MIFLRKTCYLNLAILSIAASSLFSLDKEIKPVTPNASPEAQALLKFIYSISGNYTLTGQHNFPNAKSRNSQFAAAYIGKTPVVFSTDWGFAKDGDKDSYLARPSIVEEIKRQHRLGSIIAICWHAVPPTADEPISFGMQAGLTAQDSLATVQGQLMDQQFKDILTPGTKLYNHWCAQVDSIAFFLKKLQAAHIPVLWRPYHEMNGSWFWWGGRTGKYSTAALYRQIFDRLVNHHKLNNLIWIWSVDRPVKPEMMFTYYFPGIEFLDILSLDVYRKDFNQSYYDSLVVLSQGKPLALAEVGNPPTLEILRNQPRWSFYSTWAGLVRNTMKKQYLELVHDVRILSLEDSVYWGMVAPYRTLCGLPQLPLKDTKPDSIKVNFSGEWIFNEEKSVLDIFGVNSIPYKLKITQKENDFAIQKTNILEYTDDMVTLENLTLDGKTCTSEFMNFPRITKATWSQKNDTLFVESKVTLKRYGQDVESVTSEAWSLNDKGTILSLKQYSHSFWGERKLIMIYNKE